MPTGYKKATVLAQALAALLLAISAPALAADPPFYAGVAFGQASFDTSLDTQSGSVDLLFEPDDDGDVYGLELGYQFDPDWFVGIEYSRIDADEVEIDNVYASLNYRWPLGSAGAVYVGALAGASTLDWQDAPIDTVNRERENEEPLIGAQAGFSYDLGKRWRVAARYQFLYIEHDTLLEPSSGRAKFNHEEFHQVTLAIQLRF